MVVLRIYKEAVCNVMGLRAVSLSVRQKQSITMPVGLKVMSMQESSVSLVNLLYK